MMALAATVAAHEFDRIHQKAHVAVEGSVAQQVTKFPHADSCRIHKIMQGEASNWHYLRCLWDLQ
jgi:hypothetical protein